MRKLVVLALVALVVSCGDDTTSPDMAPGTPSSLISDATHGEDRNPGFWWLPPMVPQPTLEGTFQSGYSPKVTVVCQEAIGHTDPCDPTKPLVNSTGVQAVFTRGAGLIIEADHFKVEFNTHDFNLRTTSATDTTTYRILVHTDPLTEFGGPFLIGFADFQLGANGGTARNLAVPDSMIALTDNQTLPIRFFLNEFSYEHELREFAQANPGTDATYCLINCSVTVIPGGSTGVEASLFDDVGFELTSVKFGAVNVTRVLVIDERTTEGEGANCAPGRDHEKKNCFRYDVSPTGAFPEPFALGVCPVGITFGAGIWQLVEVRDGVATVHGDTDVSAFLPCTGADGSGSASISLLRPLLDFLVAPLYAEDTKVWGGTADDFSDWFWEVPATMSTSTALTGAATPGATETLTVLVEATHPLLHEGQAVPLAGAEVTFTVTEGTGTVATSTGPGTTWTVTTDGNGLASVAFTIAAGANTLVANSTDAEGGPISFSRTGNVATVTTMEGPLPMAGVGTPRVIGASVSPAPPSGSTVEFFSDGQSIGTGTTDENGRATLTHTFTAPIQQSEVLTAGFQGAPGFDASTSAPLTQHKYQIFQDRTSFDAALGNVTRQTQDFESLAVGTAVTSVIDGVLAVSSTFEVLQVFSCASKCLFGFDLEGNPTRTNGEGRYDLQFSVARNVLAFDIVSQDPATGPATVQIVTAAGSVSIGERNPGPTESDPNFFGIILSLPIDSAAVLEGTEVESTVNEEVGLDDFVVATTLAGDIIG